MYLTLRAAAHCRGSTCCMCFGRLEQPLPRLRSSFIAFIVVATGHRIIVLSPTRSRIRSFILQSLET
jgi:hypothetical protein